MNKKNTTAEEIFYHLFGQAPQSFRRIYQSLYRRPDFNTVFNEMASSGQIILTGTGTKHDPRTVQLADGGNWLECPTCKGHGILWEQNREEQAT